MASIIAAASQSGDIEEDHITDSDPVPSELQGLPLQALRSRASSQGISPAGDKRTLTNRIVGRCVRQGVLYRGSRFVSRLFGPNPGRSRLLPRLWIRSVHPYRIPQRVFHVCSHPPLRRVCILPQMRLGPVRQASVPRLWSSACRFSGILLPLRFQRYLPHPVVSHLCLVGPQGRPPTSCAA